jgi:DNA-binding transcriptional ArsR family regulator
MNFEMLATRAADAETLLKALANRHRLMILCALHEGERSVTSLMRTIKLSQSSLSQHLARLREDKLVHTRRESQTIYYSLSDTNVSRLMALLHELYCGKDFAPEKLELAKPAKKFTKKDS